MVSFLQIIALLAGVLAYNRFKDTVFRSVVWFLLYTIVNEWAAYYYSKYFRASNMVFYNIYSIIEISYFLLLIQFLRQRPDGLKTGIVVTAIYVLGSVMELSLSSGWFKYHFLSMLFGCLMIFVLSRKYFSELLEVEIGQHIIFYPRFWLTSAILFFHLLLLVYISSHYFFPNSNIQTINRVILITNNVIFYSFLIASFLCYLSKRKLFN